MINLREELKNIWGVWYVEHKMISDEMVEIYLSSLKPVQHKIIIQISDNYDVRIVSERELEILKEIPNFYSKKVATRDLLLRIIKEKEDKVEESIIKPLGERVLIKPITKENKVGEFIVSTKSEFEPNKATVLAIGDDVSGVEIDDVVFYQEFATTKITEDENEFYIINYKDILARK